jgi:hypothetical protein
MAEKIHFIVSGLRMKILVLKPEGTRKLGRPRSRWKDNITVARDMMGWYGMD